MKKIISICLLLISAHSFAGKEIEKMAAEYYVKSDVVDTKLTSKQAKFKFEISNTDVPKSSMKISVNGVWRTVTVKAHKFEVSVQPGTYKFQFLLTTDYHEIKTENIKIEAKHVKTVVLNFRSSVREVLEEKPVIYVYSTEEKGLTVSVRPKGDFVFTYPETTGSWTGKVTESGFQIGETTYPYLFWEASQEMDLAELNWSHSSVLSKSEVLNYLEKATIRIGMNATEKTDFITYWGPRMMKLENLEVKFVTADVNELIGELTASDAEFSVQRIYVLFREVEKQESKIEMEAIAPITRSGNMILEWGGTEIPAFYN